MGGPTGASRKRSTTFVVLRFHQSLCPNHTDDMARATWRRDHDRQPARGFQRRRTPLPLRPQPTTSRPGDDPRTTNKAKRRRRDCGPRSTNSGERRPSDAPSQPAPSIDNPHHQSETVPPIGNQHDGRRRQSGMIEMIEDGDRGRA